MVRPYGLWLDALRGTAVEQIDAATLIQAAPLLAREWVEGGNRERLFDAAKAMLLSLATRRPLALALDDLQWIDEGSAALLHFLIRTPGVGPSLLFAGGARSGEVYDNPSARSLLQSLAREGQLRHFELAPLSLAEAQALEQTLEQAYPLGDARSPAEGGSTATTEGSPDRAAAWRQSGGNPLYLIELSRAARRGAVAGGDTLDALILARLQSLEGGARDLLAWAAAMGREIRLEILADAAGVALTEALARMEQLERYKLVTTTGQGHWDFAHDLIRDALYRRMSTPRRRAIHRRFVQVLAAASEDDASLHGEIVHHAELADDHLAAAGACLAAGRFCLRIFANPQAAAVAERGLGHLALIAPGAQRVGLEIGLLRLGVTAASGQWARQLPALPDRIERAIADAEALGQHAQAADGWELLAFWRQQASDSERSRDASLAAERVTRKADDTTHCLQLANSGRCLLDIEVDPARGRDLLEAAAALSRKLDLKVMEIEWGRALMARADGDLEGAREALQRAVALARLVQNHWREFECMGWLATVALEQGRLAEVIGYAGEIDDAARRMGETGAPFAQALAALARQRQGDAGVPPDADPRLAESLDGLRDRDDKSHLAYVLNEAAALALETGRGDIASVYAQEALAAAQAVRRPTEIAVAMARLASASPRAEAGVREVSSHAAACRAVADWPALWAVSGAPSARATHAMAVAARAVTTPAPTSAA